MVVAIACLSLAMLLLTALLRLAVTHHRQVQYEQMRLQADWLAEAGVERAVYSLTEDAEYGGETWTVTADDLGGVDSGQVDIQVSRSADDGGVVQVHVEAKYPAVGLRFATRTKQIPVTMAASADHDEGGQTAASAPWD
jgi:hypothetical protein